MGKEYLIDTNAVIEFLGGALPPKGNKWMQNIVDYNKFHLSVINQIKLLGFKSAPAEMQILEDFISQWFVKK